MVQTVVWAFDQCNLQAMEKIKNLAVVEMEEIKQWSKEAAINGNEFKTKRSPVAYFWSKDFTSNRVIFIVKSKINLGLNWRDR